MTERVKKELEFLKKREYRKNRIFSEPYVEKRKAIEAQSNKLKVEAELFAFAAELESPVLYSENLFGFNRLYAKPLGYEKKFGNIIPDYATVLGGGLDAICDKIKQNYESTDNDGRAFYDAVLVCYGAIFALAERYRIAAKECGYTRLSEALLEVPHKGARNYYEALVFLKILIYALRLMNTEHLPLGRFDIYMKPYFDISVSEGESTEALLELTELFFIDINLDVDLYLGIQQGDNGQSLVLGGYDADGNFCFNELSEICLGASEELNIIDPKINIRVNSTTPLSLYERGTRLTKKGLGFPQYCNDDIAIPFLTSLGYDIEDARNYAVAACWEFIVSAKGADIVNVRAINLPLAVERATKIGLVAADTFEDFMKAVKKELVAECEEQMKDCYGFTHKYPAPLLSSMISPCIERGRDLTGGGAMYFNYGFHGAGISTATDIVSAIREYVYEQKSVEKCELLEALDKNFEGYEELRTKLLNAPKMGNNDDRADDIAIWLMDICANTVNGRENGCGGVCRMGTGSAMEYVFSAEKVGATADGRRAEDNYACSYSPSLIATINGPLSAVQSFTKYDLSKICNGGPFTIEIHDTVFRNDEGEKKVAALIKTFIDLGGHQIQINSVNRERLLNAQKDPESDPNLIVRVWGWSGYFNELDKVYQDHIIRRTEYQV